MIREKYLDKTKEMIRDFIGSRDTKAFIYGSSLRKDHFGDIDVGISGDMHDRDIGELKENFEESTLPYFVDIINFDKVSDEFRNNVFNNEILWVKR